MMSPIVFAGLEKRTQSCFLLGSDIAAAHNIINYICMQAKIPPSEFKSPSRKGELVLARTIAVGLILKFNKHISLKSLGRKIGRADHTAAIYLRGKFDDFYETDKQFRAKVDRLVAGMYQTTQDDLQQYEAIYADS